MASPLDGWPQAGRERVSGSIAGIAAAFDVEVMRADTKGLELVADGPISLDVNYSFTEHDDGVSVHARVGIRRRRGLTAQLLQAAVASLLNAGALARALRKLEDSLGAPRPVVCSPAVSPSSWRRSGWRC